MAWLQLFASLSAGTVALPAPSCCCGVFLKASMMLLVAGVGPNDLATVADMSRMVAGAV